MPKSSKENHPLRRPYSLRSIDFRYKNAAAYKVTERINNLLVVKCRYLTNTRQGSKHVFLYRFFTLTPKMISKNHTFEVENYPFRGIVSGVSIQYF